MKVVIIGAGISGITAAYLLAKKRIDFEILEASSVIGGRLKKTDNFADFPIDLGAEWIHKSINARPEVISDLFDGEEKNYEIFRYLPRTIHQYKNGRLIKRKWLKYILAMIQDFKFRDSTWFDFLNKMVSEDIKRCLHLNHVVNRIDYNNDAVSVFTENGNVFECDKVIITVPIKILQEEMISFSPKMPRKQVNAINQEKVGDGIKVFIEFSERFYPDLLEIGKIIGNVFDSDSGYYDATLGKETNLNILGLFAHGKKAIRYTSLESESKIIQFILKELDEIYDGQASKHYIKHIVQNWSQETYIRGSYSQKKGNVKEMSMPLGNQVYFAGEAINLKGRTIAVHGAIESSYITIENMLRNEDNT